MKLDDNVLECERGLTSQHVHETATRVAAARARHRAMLYPECSAKKWLRIMIRNAWTKNEKRGYCRRVFECERGLLRGGRAMEHLLWPISSLLREKTQHHKENRVFLQEMWSCGRAAASFSVAKVHCHSL